MESTHPRKEKCLVKEGPSRDTEEFTYTKDRWYKENEAKIEFLYQQVEINVNRFKERGFSISASRSGRGIVMKFLSPLGFPRRSVAIEPNYPVGFNVQFSASRGDYLIGHASDRTKQRQFALDGIRKRRIRSWIKWVATGRRPFWTL